MEKSVIPTHQLPDRARVPTRVERIMPAKKAVSNDVHRHDFHELFFFEKGGGAHMIDLEQVAIHSPCVHLVAPGQVHQLDRSADMKGLVVMFATEAQLGQGHAARTELFAGGGRVPAFPLNVEQLAECNSLIQMMQVELTKSEGPVAEVVEGVLGILLIKCAHWARQSDRATGITDPSDPVHRFQELLERGFMEERHVGHYADQLAISADHLNEQVKKRLGRTTSSVIQERLMLEAKRLLLHADLSIKEVGYSLNMKDPAYFTRWFHKVEGVAPAEYRTRIREKYKH